MRLLLTRPREESETLAKKLRSHEIATDIDPLMRVEYLPTGQIDMSEYQALVFTSANGVRAFSHLKQDQTLPAFVVGDKTANIAQQVGFKHVISADGDVNKLSWTIIDTLSPADGPLLYLSGVDRAGSLCDDLAAAGFKINHCEIYQTIAAEGLDPQTKKLLNSASIDYIPFYSPRSALIFKGLIEKAGLENTLANVSALCLSAAVAKEISSLDWKEVLTAGRPTQEDLLQMIDIEL